MFKISPSILSADFSNLKGSIDEIKDYCEYIHIDVMDGVFVNNITIGIPVVKALKKHFSNIFDVHLMIVNPIKYIKEFAEAGSDIITFHYETGNVLQTINEIKKYNKKVGLSIKPGTDPKEIIEYLALVDLVLVMSVEPGFGGQKFMDNSLNKIKYLSELKKACNYSYEIEVDGGINAETSKLVKQAGVDVMVAGSFIFSAENKIETIIRLKE